ncbi:hypothetical protein AMTR_s00141p00099390 [Amborella trichopoda]|uniref:Uncharacterized protein n=1 Tax=Amborella trichopoda TaxID=13333 RepID=W1PGB2_AMBTC|nr:hypothetical protein AMTR_s00141p00099390 [Amborella trichopoda]
MSVVDETYNFFLDFVNGGNDDIAIDAIMHPDGDDDDDDDTIDVAPAATLGFGPMIQLYESGDSHADPIASGYTHLIVYVFLFQILKLRENFLHMETGAVFAC